MKRLFPKLFLMIFLVGLLLFKGLPLFSWVAAASVVGDIIQDTTWVAADSPYEITNDVKVYSGVTLTIEPGVLVSFDENATLTVEGSLFAIGNSSNRITFTSDQPTPARGQWTNIRFVGADNESFILKFVDVAYAKNGIVVESLGNAVIEKSRVTSNSLSGIHVIGQGNVVIKENTINQNGNGITTEGNTSSGIEIVGNIIVFNDEYGVSVSSNDADFCSIHNVTISGNIISRNGNGIYVFSNAGVEKDAAHVYEVTVTNNTISFNHHGIHLRTHGWYAGYIYDSTISNNTIVLNEDGINIYSGSNWYSWISDVTISNNKVLANKNGISLKAFRTPELPYKNVPFDTTIAENIVSGNNNTGVSIAGDVRANLTGNSVSYNSYGIYTTSKDNLARKNDIYRNSLYGMYVDDKAPIAVQIDAENNFWGASNGPFHESLASDGQGDQVNGDGENLDFYPFLPAPLGYINEAPVAKLGVSEIKIPLNQTVTLYGLQSEDDSRVANYFFDFGDGENSGWVSVPIVEHEYVSQGVYEISLVVIDEFGVRNNNTAIGIITVSMPLLTLSVFLDPIAVFSQGQVLIEVDVTDEEAVGVEDVLIQLTLGNGGTLNPAFGYTDTNGYFNSTFHAPEVSETTSAEITVTAFKEGCENRSEPVYLSILKAQSDGTGFEIWIWPVATLAVVTVALATFFFVKRQKKQRRYAKRKSSSHVMLLAN